MSDILLMRRFRTFGSIMRPAGNTRKVGVLALPGAQLLDLAGPLDVFAEANVQSGKNTYGLLVIGTEDGPVVSSSGVRVLPDYIVGRDDIPALDTLLVAGAPSIRKVPLHPGLLDWLRAQAPKSRRFGSVCSGAMLLAETGLLKGKRITTHWAMADELARKHPDIEIEVDALHVRDGQVRTAAGVTAGLDLALALVEEDLGREIAKKVASKLVMFFRRPGGQLQFSRRGEANPSGRSALQDIQRWVMANPAADASTAALAARAGLSARHFVRLFKQELGMSPAEWVQQVRVALARQMLEAGDHAKQVAAASGFADMDTFRRVFQRHVGITPAEYRRRYEVLEPEHA
jgi:transcriptional regulator GlxA family with amidase domain